MKVIIPAKCNSSRTLNKNWREFVDGKCLVEIKIGQLIEAGVDSADINVFCEQESKRSKVERLGAKFVLRDAANTKDDMHWSDVITTLVSSVDAEDDESIAWVQATTPLFGPDEYQKIFEYWRQIQSREGAFSTKWNQYDSIITVRPIQHFILNDKGRPVNYNFGRWHEWSQDLETWYTLEQAIHIMLKKDYLKHNYYIGSKPYLYGSHPDDLMVRSIDIDEPWQFEDAQRLFRQIFKKDIGK